MSKLKWFILDGLKNRLHRKDHPECDVLFLNGNRVWKRSLKEGELANICMPCHQGVTMLGIGIMMSKKRR